MLSNELSVVYNHYQELARNEDYLFNDRLNLFFTAHSILFLSYITTLTVENLAMVMMRPFLCGAGIILSLFGICLTVPANMAWKRWMLGLAKIEECIGKEQGKEQQDYCFPSQARASCNKEELRRFWKGLPFKFRLPWIIGCWVFPIVFVIIWGFSLVVSIRYI